MVLGYGGAVNKSELAKRVGVSVNTVDSWVRAGLPYSKRGGVYSFDLAAVRRWRREHRRAPVSRDCSLAEAQRRKETALAELRECDARERRGELVERAAVSREWFRLARQVRDGILNLPDRLAGVLVSTVRATPDDLAAQQAVHTAMTTELRQVLEALANEPCAR